MKKAGNYMMNVMVLATIICLGYTLIFNKPLNFVMAFLSILESIAVIIIAIMPKRINRKNRYYIPDLLYISVILYVFLGVICGDVLDLFDVFPWFDALLHLYSGFILVVLAYYIANTVLRNLAKKPATFISIFAFCFSATLGIIWEVYEYVVDDIFDSNMQTYMTASASSFKKDGDIPLTGHEAIKDTMEDIILNAAAGLVTCSYGYYSIKNNRKNYSTNSFIKDKK